MTKVIIVGLGIALVSAALGIRDLLPMVMFAVGANVVFWVGVSLTERSKS